MKLSSAISTKCTVTPMPSLLAENQLLLKRTFTWLDNKKTKLYWACYLHKHLEELSKLESIPE